VTLTFNLSVPKLTDRHQGQHSLHTKFDGSRLICYFDLN